MRILMFYHSILSDWNHGNAHFLRGVATELMARGHQVLVLEPRASWSARNLIAEFGRQPIYRFHQRYPLLKARRYHFPGLDLNQVLDGADLVLVHEWNDHSLVKAIGEHHAHHRSYRLFFHDTHHRLVSDPDAMGRYDLDNYDGILAYGTVLRDLYQRNPRVRRAWTWHEAADTRVFVPSKNGEPEGDLVWIGNWGDGERAEELHEFLIQPVQELRLKARVYGVRYPLAAQRALAAAGIEYAGWLPNFEAPQVFSRFRVTIHVPRRHYVKTLPGIPTIRPFEALACGIPLICSSWHDAENLFTPGRDFLIAHSGKEMKAHLSAVLQDSRLARSLVDHGLRTIQTRHTCAHRVTELLAIDHAVREAAGCAARDRDPARRFKQEQNPEITVTERDRSPAPGSEILVGDARSKPCYLAEKADPNTSL